MIVLAVAGLMTGFSWSVVTSIIFKMARRVLGYGDDSSWPIDGLGLIIHVVGVLVSGLYLFLLVILAARWADYYPQYRSTKDMFWVGIVVGALFWRLLVGKTRGQ